MKRLAAVAFVAAGMFVGSGIASAENLQQDPTVVLNPASVAPGGPVMASLRVTCVDGASIRFEIEPAGDVWTAICNNNNNTYAARLTAPTRPAAYDVNAVGETLIARTTLTVTAALGSPEQPLASTGPEHTLSLAVIAGALFAGGATLLGLARFRDRRAEREVG